MTSANRVVRGATWSYGSQVVTVVGQFMYAAATSRIVEPEGFGEYGVALTVAALIMLIANGGLGNAVGRMENLQSLRLRALNLYGLLLGAVGAAALWLSADFWANLWSVPGAATPVKWLAISAFLSPCFGLSTGLLRRQGHFRQLAIVTLTGNFAGMAMGLIGVFIWQNSSSLLISPIVGQISVLLVAFRMNWSSLIGRSQIRVARDDISFSWRLTLVAVTSYFSGNVGRWSVSTSMGAATIGQWNRADVVTTVPFQQIQTAIVQAVYPEFRHDIADRSRAKRVWPDMLAMAAWIVIPASVVAAIVLPYAIPILFGPGWEVAARFAVPLAFLSGIQMLSVLLGSGIEALGKFRWIWSMQTVALVTNTCGAMIGLYLEDWVPVILAMIASFVFQHTIQIFLCSRAGLLCARQLVAAYARVVMGAGLLGGIVWLITKVLFEVSVISVALVCLISITFGTIIWTFRNRLEPVKIARRYGLFGAH